MTTPLFDEIIASLNTYYAETPLEFSIGLQNFQSIREYTKIPLAPITLIYGQNSAGKSAIHDALLFIHDFLGDKSKPAFAFQLNSVICAQYLDRWASYQRVNRLLSKGYIGQPDDVVISINAWTRYISHDLLSDCRGIGQLLHDIFSACNDAPFSIRFHFSKEDDEWYTREFHLVIGGDEFISYTRNENPPNTYPERDCDSFFRINLKHLFCSALENILSKPLAEMAKESEFFNGKTVIEDDWLVLTELWFVGNSLEWSYEYDSQPMDYDNYLEFDFNQAEAFRLLIEGLLMHVFNCGSKFSKVDTVPPLRPVPTKSESCFRISSSDSFLNKDHPWKMLAIAIRDWQIGYLGNRLQPHFGSLETGGSSQLDYVNHALQHPFFLNTGYEIIGECKFLLSAQYISEIQNDKNDHITYHGQFIDAEVTLKLRYIPDNFTVEIEDVGVGISQVIPVLYAICNASNTYIHQPELHLHPKLQSHLGDMFIERVNENYYSSIENNDIPHTYFLIETHSEHILLRILRRIRETHQSDIRHKLFGFTSDQLAVLYVDKDENGDSTVSQLRVSENGEFIDRWPHGFFTERDADLFDE